MDEPFVNNGGVGKDSSEERITTQTNSLEELEENLRNIQVSDEQEKEVLNQAEDAAIEDFDWLYFPRAGNTFGARFELPIDLRKLKSKFASRKFGNHLVNIVLHPVAMTPLEYLSNYVVATRCRMRLNDVVFERHSTELKLPVEVRNNNSF